MKITGQRRTQPLHGRKNEMPFLPLLYLVDMILFYNFQRNNRVNHKEKTILLYGPDSIPSTMVWHLSRRPTKILFHSVQVLGGTWGDTGTKVHGWQSGGCKLEAVAKVGMVRPIRFQLIYKFCYKILSQEHEEGKGVLKIYLFGNSPSSYS